MSVMVNPLTELDAVNIILSTIGQAPLTVLTTGEDTDVDLARGMLDETIRSFLIDETSFNVTDEVTLSPNSLGEIEVGTNVASLDVLSSETESYTLRGSKLYNRKTGSEFFEDSVKAKVTYFLPFIDLPPHARYYYTILAAQKFQSRIEGSDTNARFTADDLARAQIAYEKIEGLIEDANILYDNYHSFQIVHRGGPRRAYY